MQESGRNMTGETGEIKSKSTAIAMIVCFYAEAAFSDAFRLLYETAGKAAPICAAVAGAAVSLLIPVANKAKKGMCTFIICAVYALLIMFRLASNAVYLYNGAITVYVIIAAAVLAVIAGVKGLRGAGIYAALCFVPLAAVFAVCCLFGGMNFHTEYLKGFILHDISGILAGIMLSLSLFAPALIAAVFTHKSTCRVCMCASAASSLAVTAMLFIAVGVFGATAQEYPSIVAELSKNVSVGKFFQRLEGFADTSYIAAASVAVVMLGSMIESNCTFFTVKYKKALCVAAVFAFAAVSACLSVKDETLSGILQLVTVWSGIAVAVFLIIRLFGLKRTAAAVCTLAIMCMCSCTSSREIERQTFAVIAAFDSADDKIHIVTENGDGKNLYSVEAKNLSEAIKTVESTKSLSISLLQTELILICGDEYGIDEVLNQVIYSDVPNSASVMLMKGSFEEMYNNISEKYESAFDFVSSIQSGAEKGGYVCPQASAVKAALAETGTAEIGIIGENGTEGNSTIRLDRKEYEYC